KSLRQHHVAVVGREDDDGVFCYFLLLERLQQAIETIVESRHMGVVAAQNFLCLGSFFRRHIGPKLYLSGLIHRAILLRCSFIGKMGRTERKKKEERIVGMSTITDKSNRVVSLGKSIVAGPVPRRRIVV